MAKNTSPKESTAPNLEATQATASVANQVDATLESQANASRSSAKKVIPEETTTETINVALSPAVTNYDHKLQVLEDKLKLQIAQNSRGGSTSFLWAVVLLTLAAASYAGFTTFNNQNQLNTLETKYSNAQQKIDTATFKIEQSATLLENAQSNNAALQQTNHDLQQSNATLAANDQKISEQVAELIALQKRQAEEFTAVSNKVDVFSERNPNDWMLSESFFLVNNATQKAIFEKDTVAAVWMLTKADELLVHIETEEVLALREAISKDISTLNNLKKVDFRGMGLNLDRAFDNVELLVLNEFSDAKTRAANYEKQSETTADIKDWKQNLLNSANDFASRFVEVRRRDPNAVAEFLTPSQDVYLRENIKTRILLAKANLSHGEKAEMDKNLSEAIKLIKAYYDAKSEVTQSTIALLEGLVQSDITINTPEVLQSSQAFATFAKEHLLGR